MPVVKNIMSAVFAAFIGLGATLSPATADEISDFYKDKLIKIIIGSGPGGGYDTYARLVKRNLGRHIPGNPKIVAVNKNGAASVVATNYITNVAPQDGTIIAGIQREIALVQLMGRPQAKFKAEKIQWLGSLAKEAGVCAVAKHSGIKRFEDAYDKEYAVGATGKNATEFWPALFNNLVVTKFKLIRGYPGTPQIHLAIQRKELDGVCQSWASFKEIAGSYLPKMVPLVQVSLQPDPEMQKLGVPMLADILTKENLAKGQNVEDVRTFFKLTMVPGVMGRPFAMAPGVPKARVQAVRKAFVAMVKDPLFLKQAKRVRREVELVTGEEIQKIVEDIAKVPKTTLAALNGHFKFKGKVEKVVLPIVVDEGKVIKTKRGGRRITIKTKGQGKKRTAKVSGKRTKVTIKGKKVKRKAIKVGMSCAFHYYGHKTRAKKIVCR